MFTKLANSFQKDISYYVGIIVNSYSNSVSCQNFHILGRVFGTAKLLPFCCSNGN